MERESNIHTDQDNLPEQEGPSAEQGNKPAENAVHGNSPQQESATTPVDQEKNKPEKETGEETIDYTTFSKEELLAAVKNLHQEADFRKSGKELRLMRKAYASILDKEKVTALERFKEEGGGEEEFEYVPDKVDVDFEIQARIIKEKSDNYFRNQEKQKAENLKLKSEVLEKIRALTEAEDTEHSFGTFKELQNQWKSIGPIPAGQAKSLWANYNALVDLFYDQRSIYFELKELDRKKNLESKLELCERAEALRQVESINEAVKELNELHHEFKHIGPVPIEEKEPVWQRFKKASDEVYERRDALMMKLNEEFQKNLDLKLQVCEELTPFTTFDSDRIKEWNQKTQEILEVQKKWEGIGSVPRTKTKEVNKKFWSNFKTFFAHKNAFFKKLDSEREGNLKVKLEIIEKAKAAQENNDWDRAAGALKDLQRQWKEVGQVPEKQRDKVYKEFKGICDAFFERRRAQFQQQDEDRAGNLIQKEALCAELEQAAQNGSGSVEMVKQVQEKFNSIGFVPKPALQPIRDRFQKAVESCLKSIEGVDDEDMNKMLMEVEVAALKSSPQSDKKINMKAHTIRKKISKVENDIAVLRNNLEFFGRSENAEKFKEEFNDKLKDSSELLEQLKSQLRMLETVS